MLTVKMIGVTLEIADNVAQGLCMPFVYVTVEEKNKMHVVWHQHTLFHKYIFIQIVNLCQLLPYHLAYTIVLHRFADDFP